MVDPEPQDPDRLTLASKINRAFEALHPPGRGPYTNREVAAWFAAHSAPGEPTISVNYLMMLRSGERDNPTVRHLRALARFFDIPATYFLDDSEDADAVHRDLEMISAMRDADVRAIATRAMELDPSLRGWLRATLDGLTATEAVGDATRRRRRFIAGDDTANGG